MGASQSSFATLIKSALDNDDVLYAFPSDPFYRLKNVKPYNLSIPITPVVVTYPRNTEQVAKIVKCAADANLKVQARCGGHSFANYCLGGADGAVVIDLKHFQKFSMNRMTWRATVGGGTLLGDLTKRLHEAGNRAIAHGTCPQVGIGGHATIGGMGPSSRLYGTALDHVEEVEIVLADSTVKRASATENTDIFWAVRGAGASFGIITEFVLRTEPEPGEVVQFSYSLTVGSYASMGDAFKAWQRFISDPNLTRKFASEVIFTHFGMIVSGTYFGSREEFDDLSIDSKFPGHQNSKTVIFKDWMGLVGHWAQRMGLLLGGGLPVPFYTKSLTFNECNLIPDHVIDQFLGYLDAVRKGTMIWFVIFDLQGGAINDVPQEATAYAHRDALFFMQSYAVGVGKVSETTKNFLRGLNLLIKDGMPGGKSLGTYPGYVDPELVDGQREYWGENLPRLERIKRMVDPDDVFSNPQSVRPAIRSGDREYGKEVVVEKVVERKTSRWGRLCR